MTGDEHSTRANQTATRGQHAGLALFWVLVSTAMFAGAIYLIDVHADHTAYAASLGIVVGMFLRDYFMEYVTHALGVLNPVWASRVAD